MGSIFCFRLQSGSSCGAKSLEWQVPTSGGTIGRAPECNWVLDDPHKIVSRRHARVVLEHMKCMWTDLGTNPTLLNGYPLACGQPVVVAPGDQLQIGDYTMTLVGKTTEWPGVDSPQALPAGEFTGIDLFGPANLPSTIDALLSAPNLDIDPYSAESRLSETPAVSVLARQMNVFCQQAAPEQGLQACIPEAFSDLQHEQELKKMRSLLAASVQGYMRLLGARKVFRQETGSQLTAMSSSANNPLKVCSSAEEAMQLLLTDSGGTYLPASRAIEQACDDVMVHMHASVAHIQSLIRQIHTLLNPEEIEKEAAQAGGFAIGLSATRKARMWDLYCQRYTLLDKKWS